MRALLLLFLAGCGAAAAPAPKTAAAAPTTFEWQVAEKWKKETIPFPLDFAPSLSYRGTEELRFAPGFFDPKADGYWSYAFVWWFDSGPEINPAQLTTDLKTYFDGLTSAVAKDDKEKWQPDLSKIQVQLDNLPGDTMTGRLQTIDAFKTHEPVSLHVKATKGACGSHRYLIVIASPADGRGPMWASLETVAASFKCR